MITDHSDDREPTEALPERLAEAEEMLRAIRHGEIDALVVESARGHQVYTLRSAEEPYRDLVEQMPEGAVVLTRCGDILYCNARFALLVDEPLESVVGSRIDRFVHAVDREDFEALLGAGGGRQRISLIGSKSGAFEVSLSLTTTPSPNGDRLNLIVTDLRELLEANSGRDQAERDTRTKNEFLAMLAHELRNPVGAIGNAIRVLESADAHGELAASAHDVIARQVTHLSHLINDLLDVERVVSGRIRLNRQPLDLDRVGEDVRQHLLEPHGVAVDPRGLGADLDVPIHARGVRDGGDRSPHRTVVASSPGEGHGSTFTVRLRQVPSAQTSPAALPAPERRAHPRRVLLIEDSDDAREMLRMMLELAGHVVYDAADGARGLELLNAERPDVGIIDIGLPTMDGYQVAKRIREEPHGRGMLLLALTGSDPRDTRSSREHGFDHHLLKPVDPDRLARLLSEGATPQGIST